MANKLFDTLRYIVQEVNDAPGLEVALNIVVKRTRQHLSADAVSVYFRDDKSHELVLMATDGLNKNAVGKIRFKHNEGLVGLVASQAELINLRDAHSHSAYQLIQQTDEVTFHGFLGVPVIQHSDVLGVLVVRQKAKRKLSDNSETFLVTLAAQLAGAISHAKKSGEITGLFEQVNKESLEISGLQGAPGVAIAPAHVVYLPAQLEAVPDQHITVEEVQSHIVLFNDALQTVALEFRALAEKMQGVLPAEELALFDVYILMLKSETLVDAVIQRIEARQGVQSALRDTIADHVRQFDAMGDAYFSERAVDIKDLGRRILKCLQKQQSSKVDINSDCILVGEEIVVSQFSEIPLEYLKGIISSKGSASSHVAILANALGIPCVMGAESLPVSRLEAQLVIVDGYQGRVYIKPGKVILNEYQNLIREAEKRDIQLNGIIEQASETLDGVHIPLHVNTGLLADISPSLQSGAEGVGLYRTEIPFLIRDGFPGEDEQVQIYQQILREFSPRPVTFRTLDIGGDKALPYFPVIEDNPFLGWRGIRIMLDHPEIFLTQIRAILKSNIYENNLRLMLPMISDVGELDAAIAYIRQVHSELLAAGINVPFPVVGVMIEVPSALFQIEAFAKRVDFFSIGTNDLTQYLLAVDRNNKQVAALYDCLHPAVLKAIEHIVNVSHENNKTVSVCGEMAGDPVSAFALLALGVDSLSMSVGSLLKVKWMLRSFSKAHAEKILSQALKLEKTSDIRMLFSQAIAEQEATNSFV